MAEQQFAIVFRGRLLAGADPLAVRANFAKLFNIDAARVEQMFSGQPVIIKKGLDLLGADKYKAALAKAGALVDAIDMPADGALSAPPPVAAEPPISVATPAPVSAVPSAASHPIDPTLARGAPPAALRGTPNPLTTTLAEPGAMLVEARPIAPAVIATEHLTLAAPGALLIEPHKSAPVQFDLSGLSLETP